MGRLTPTITMRLIALAFGILPLFSSSSQAWGQSASLRSAADPTHQPAAASTSNNQWRYRWHNNHWWYWTANEKWVIYDNQAWVPFDAETYPFFYRRFNPEPLRLSQGFDTGSHRSYRAPTDGYDRVRAFGFRQDILNAGVLGTRYGGYGSELGGYSGYRGSTGANIGSFGEGMGGQGAYFGSGIGRGIGPRR